MSGGGPSIVFLVAGIVFNIVITGLAIWWLLKQVRGEAVAQRVAAHRLHEARESLEVFRRRYNEIRPHRARSSPRAVATCAGRRMSTRMAK